MKLSDDGTLLIEIEESDIKPDGSVDIPNGVTAIEMNAFNGCHSLQMLIIPPEVRSIGSFAFGDCINLKTFILPKGTPSISRFLLNGCHSLQVLTIPAGINSIGELALDRCPSLHSIVNGLYPFLNFNSRFKPQVEVKNELVIPSNSSAVNFLMTCFSI